MSKSISIALLDHYQQPVTTKCNLLKITARDGTVLGLTSLDRSVTYNDGAGDVVYNSPIGIDTFAMESSADLSVDNTEVEILLADSDEFSDEQINAGVLDYGKYIVYRINWADVSQGREILDFGTIGIVKNVNGLAGVIELRSTFQQLKQTYGNLYSITCRAEFGSGGGGACVGFGECGFDAESLWQNHSVASVGAETDRIFTADTTPAVSGPNGALSFAPGLVRWLTGDNAGLTSEIESTSGAEITLRFGTPYAIQASDTFKTRPDCDKTWETCRDDYANQLNFRGEPKIPLADESSQATPNFSGTWAGTATPAPPASPDVTPPPPSDPPPPPPPEPPVDATIVNPGFENNLTGWVGSGWGVNGVSPRNGSRNAYFGVIAIGEAPLRQSKHVPVTPGTSITASCWAKLGVSSPQSAAVTLRWYDSGDALISDVFGNVISSGTAWQKSTVTDTAPGGAAFVSVGVRGYGGDGQHSIYVDDFEWDYG